jgi:hypothetical protein
MRKYQGALGPAMTPTQLSLPNRPLSCIVRSSVGIGGAVPQSIEQILEGIASMLQVPKDLLLDGIDWQRRPRAGGFDSLELAVPVAVGGAVRDGLAVRISCRSDLCDCDVHAHLQVYIPALASYANVQRVEWRPNGRHTNDGNAPAALKFKTFEDRWYEFGLNRRLGVGSLRQTVKMIAQGLPRPISDFNELLAFLEEVWNVQGVVRIPPPPWEGRLA